MNPKVKPLILLLILIMGTLSIEACFKFKQNFFKTLLEHSVRDVLFFLNDILYSQMVLGWEIHLDRP